MISVNNYLNNFNNCQYALHLEYMFKDFKNRFEMLISCFNHLSTFLLLGIYCFPSFILSCPYSNNVDIL